MSQSPIHLFGVSDSRSTLWHSNIEFIVAWKRNRRQIQFTYFVDTKVTKTPATFHFVSIFSPGSRRALIILQMNIHLLASDIFRYLFEISRWIIFQPFDGYKEMLCSSCKFNWIIISSGCRQRCYFIQLLFYDDSNTQKKGTQIHL